MRAMDTNTRHTTDDSSCFHRAHSGDGGATWLLPRRMHAATLPTPHRRHARFSTHLLHPVCAGRIHCSSLALQLQLRRRW